MLNPVLQAWWLKEQSKRPETRHRCIRLLQRGNQRDRFVAALELALHLREKSYINVKQCGLRQLPKLSAYSNREAR
jgi:hypothetical protein